MSVQAAAEPASRAHIRRHECRHPSSCKRSIEVLLHVHPNDDGCQMDVQEREDCGPQRLRDLVPRFVPSTKVDAQLPIRVKGAFELNGTCNETHTVRYALASNGGPTDRWRKAINVHLIEAGARQHRLANVLPSDYAEAAHLLYAFYTPWPHTNLRGGVEGFVGVVGFSLFDRLMVPPYAPSLVRRAAMRLRYEPHKRRTVGGETSATTTSPRLHACQSASLLCDGPYRNM